jgi:hypothetical protein
MPCTWDKAHNEFIGIEVATIYERVDLLIEFGNALLVFF